MAADTALKAVTSDAMSSKWSTMKSTKFLNLRSFQCKSVALAQSPGDGFEL